MQWRVLAAVTTFLLPTVQELSFLSFFSIGYLVWQSLENSRAFSQAAQPFPFLFTCVGATDGSAALLL